MADAPKYFFSYERSDSNFALRLAKELRAAGAIVWVDQLDILAGERWDKVVETALHACSGMIIILSPNSIASNNVMDEVSYALGHDKVRRSPSAGQKQELTKLRDLEGYPCSGAYLYSERIQAQNFPNTDFLFQSARILNSQ